MDKRIEIYVNKLLKQLHYPRKDRKEIGAQYIDHILSLKNEYLQNGCDDDTACECAINEFGSMDQLSQYTPVMSKLEYALKLSKKKYIISLYGIIVTFLVFYHKNDISEGFMPHQLKTIINVIILISFLKIIKKFKTTDKRIVLLFILFSIYMGLEIILGGIRIFDNELYDILKYYLIYL